MCTNTIITLHHHTTRNPITLLHRTTSAIITLHHHTTRNLITLLHRTTSAIITPHPHHITTKMGLSKMHEVNAITV
ncbi:hypothetical protein Lal_00023512 [Lupinus albus]|nr:hypothetical protein Lal_00023512 [Lupinus albus]